MAASIRLGRGGLGSRRQAGKDHEAAPLRESVSPGDRPAAGGVRRKPDALGLRELTYSIRKSPTHFSTGWQPNRATHILQSPKLTTAAVPAATSKIDWQLRTNALPGELKTLGTVVEDPPGRRTRGRVLIVGGSSPIARDSLHCARQLSLRQPLPPGFSSQGAQPSRTVQRKMVEPERPLESELTTSTPFTNDP